MQGACSWRETDAARVFRLISGFSRRVDGVRTCMEGPELMASLSKLSLTGGLHSSLGTLGKRMVKGKKELIARFSDPFEVVLCDP